MVRNEKITFERPEVILMFSFRYALGRKSMASVTVVDEVVSNWRKLSIEMKEQIKREITEAILHKKAGMQCDVDQWQRVLDLPITEETAR